MDWKEIRLSNTTSNSSSTNEDGVVVGIRISVYLLLSVVGTCCNLHNLITIYYTPSLRTLNNSLLIALGMNDLLTASIGLPLLIATTLISGQTLCNIQGTINTMSGACSLLLTFSISIDRCHAVILPYSYLRHLTYPKYIFIALTLYLSSFLGAILPLLNQEKYGFGKYDHHSDCWVSLTASSDNIVIVGLAAFSGIGVISGIIICYIILFLIAYQKSTAHLDDTVRLRTSLRTVILIVGTTVICWIPWMAIVMTNTMTFLLYGYSNVISEAVADLVLDLVISNVAINPVIYMWTNSILRKKLIKNWQKIFYTNKVVPLARSTTETVEQI